VTLTTTTTAHNRIASKIQTTDVIDSSISKMSTAVAREEREATVRNTLITRERTRPMATPDATTNKEELITMQTTRIILQISTAAKVRQMQLL